MRSYAWIAVLVLLASLSCTATGGKPRPIEVNRMKLIMWDLIKADEWYIQRTSKDSTLRKTREDIRLYEQVFAIHGISRDAYYKSYKYYEAHPVEFKVLIDSLDAFSNREKSKIENHGQAR